MMITGWEKALAEYIDERRNVPFTWGTHDCISFSNGAMRRLTGTGYADEWVKRYKTALGAARYYKKQEARGEFKTIIEAIDAKLNRVAFPLRGSIVAREMAGEFLGYRLGVCIGTKVAFVAEHGLIFELVESDDIAWGEA